MVKYIIAMTTLMLIVACSSKNTQSEFATIELGFSAQDSYLLQAQYSLTAIYLVNTANEKILLSDQIFRMGYLSGQKAPSLLLTANVPVGEYRALYLVADLSDPVFRTLYKGQLETLTLIDALNRSIPQAHQLYPLEIPFTEGPFIADQGLVKRLHLIFDGEKSVQPLYQFEDKSGIKALFKPFFLVETLEDQTVQSAYSFVSTNYKTIQMASFVTDAVKSIDIAAIADHLVNDESVEESELFEYLQRKSANIIHWSTGNKLHVEYADELFTSAILLKNTNKKGYRLSGYFFRPEQRKPIFAERVLPLTQSVIINNTIGQPQITQLNSLLPGQKVDARKQDNIWTMTLEDGLMVGVIKSVNPLIIEPVVYNTIKLAPDSEFEVIGEDLPIMSIGAIVEMRGYKVGEAFFASQLTLLDNRKVSMTIRLPASSGNAMVIDTEDKFTWSLSSDLSDYAQVNIELGQTGLRIPYIVNTLLLHDARFSIYTDRILYANRQTTFLSSDDFFQTLVKQLEAGHHINEIHIKGIMQESDLKVHEINFVCYGTSLFDLVNTEEIVEKGGSTVVQEEPEKQPVLTQSPGSGLNRNSIIGLSVGLGLPVIGGLTYFIFRLASNALRNQGGQPIKDQSGEFAGKTSTKTSVSNGDVTVTSVSKPNLASSNVNTRNHVNTVVTPEPGLSSNGKIVENDDVKSAQSSNLVNYNRDSTKISGGSDPDRPVLPVDRTIKDNDDSAQSSFVPTIDYLLDEYPQLLQDNYLGRFEDNITGNDLKPLLVRRQKHPKEKPEDYKKMPYELVETELLLKYLERYSAQATTPQLYQADLPDLPPDEDYLWRKDAENVLRNAFVFIEGNGLQALGAGTSDADANLMAFLTGFIENDQARYAILPVSDTTHFTSVVFTKDANGQLARAVYIDPLYSKKLFDLESGAISKNILLIDKRGKRYDPHVAPPFIKLSQVINTINPDVQLEPYFPEIQKDYCSCGPIAMVVATDLVTILDNRRLAGESGSIDDAVNVDIDEILQQTKSRYKSDPGHEDIRIKLLKTLDSTSRLNVDRHRASIERYRRR